MKLLLSGALGVAGVEHLPEVITNVAPVVPSPDISKLVLEILVAVATIFFQWRSSRNKVKA